MLQKTEKHPDVLKTELIALETEYEESIMADGKILFVSPDVSESSKLYKNKMAFEKQTKLKAKIEEKRDELRSAQKNQEVISKED